VVVVVLLSSALPFHGCREALCDDDDEDDVDDDDAGDGDDVEIAMTFAEVLLSGAYKVSGPGKLNAEGCSLDRLAAIGAVLGTLRSPCMEREWEVRVRGLGHHGE
jgi:hypothetical protein